MGYIAAHRDWSVPEAARSRVAAAIPVLKKRAKTIAELADGMRFLAAARPLPFTEAAQKLLTSDIRERLTRLSARLTQATWENAASGALLKAFATDEGVGMGQIGPDQDFSFIDLGSGSGAIGITLACERPRSRGTCTDISDAALAVTRQNAIALGVGDRLTTLHSNWLTNVTGRFDLIVSNPPYIAHDVIPNLEPDVRDHDPHLALDGGHDGLDCYRTIAATAGPNLAPQGKIVVEIGASQAMDITEIFRKQGFRLTDQRLDLGGHVRALMFSTG